MTNSIKFVFIILSIIILSSCGFKPMYAKNSNNSDLLHQVQLVEVSGKDAPRAERIISELIKHSSNPQYYLKINVEQSMNAIGVQKDSTNTRYQLRVTFKYQLFEASTYNIIDRGQIYLYSSYDIVDQDFQNYIAERYTSDNILYELSKELRNKLILVISSRS